MGHQTRSLQLLSHVDGAHVTAKLEHGMLRVSALKLAGHEVVGRRRIAINAA